MTDMSDIKADNRAAEEAEDRGENVALMEPLLVSEGSRHRVDRCDWPCRHISHLASCRGCSLKDRQLNLQRHSLGRYRGVSLSASVIPVQLVSGPIPVAGYRLIVEPLQ
jgi:hypothetical protein